eukprot:GEZU01025912.1.p1 GENE.GEZU01025912.1~~GEZU01025912.1.p1  ORF type:complete len:352 (-),score=40.67 GEZU01025912.1:61-1116(-)
MKDRFRNQYYSSLGLQPDDSLTKAKSIEAILKEKLVDTARIRTIAIQCGVPHKFRGVVWKLLLGLFSPYSETWEFVDEQFKEEFDDMSKAAIACGYASPLDSFDHNDNDSEALIQGGDVHQITAAAHLASIIMAQEKMLTPQTLQQHCKFIPLQEHRLVSSASSISIQPIDKKQARIHVTRMADVFLSVCKQPEPAFWCLAAFMHTVTKGASLADTVLWHVNELYRLLSSVVGTHTDILMHLTSTGVEMDQVFSSWFASVFAFHLLPATVRRLWDAVLAFPSEFITYVALAFVVCLKPQFMNRTHAADITNVLTNLRDYDIELVLALAIDLFKSEAGSSSSSSGGSSNSKS